MLIGISGKKGTGKDLIAKIIQYLVYVDEQRRLPSFSYTIEEWWEDVERGGIDAFPIKTEANWTNKKFADKLKDMICTLLGCTRRQLEDEAFKNKSLGDEWIRYSYATGFTKDNNGGTTMLSTQCSKSKYEEELLVNWQTAYKTIMNPRILMQTLGTQWGRNIINENIWVLATMSNYIGTFIGDHDGEREPDEYIFPNWIISDVRFPNEVDAISKRGGVIIRVERGANSLKDNHASETALDDYVFEYTINNNGTIEELVETVRLILVKENIL